VVKNFSLVGWADAAHQIDIRVGNELPTLPDCGAIEAQSVAVWFVQGNFWEPAEKPQQWRRTRILPSALASLVVLASAQDLTTVVHDTASSRDLS
jgi:hypothetical protein